MPLSAEQRLLLFKYDSGRPLDVRYARGESDDKVTIERLSIAGAGGERVPLALYRPAQSNRRLPVVLIGHGLGMGKDHVLLSALMRAWAGYGVACVGVDAPFHGERSAQFADPLALLRLPEKGLAFVTQTVVDNRRVLDWLETRPDLDASRLGYAGLSLGSLLGVPFVAAEPRVRAAVFALGGAGMMHYLAGMAPPQQRARFAEVADAIDPLHYAPLDSPRPVLMVNGSRDSVIPPALGHLLFNALREPKRILWYDGEHGAIPREHLHEMRLFLENALVA